MSYRSHILDSPIEYLKGIGPKRGESFKKELEVFTFGDLLAHFPFRYVDKTQLYRIADISPDTPHVQLRGVITNIQTAGAQRTTRLTASFSDGTGIMDLTWFKGISYMKSYLKTNTEYLVYGKPRMFRNQFSISHPDIELVEDKKMQFENRLEAVYPSTEKLKNKGLDSRGIHKAMKMLFEKITPRDVTENLPPSLIQNYQLMGRWDALKNIHLPENEQLIQQAQFRLKFEDFFFIQMRMLQSKVQRMDKYKGYLFPELGEYFLGFFNTRLPFELTNAQKRVLREIRRDTLSGRHMNRLLQGDVGSGKTIVALMTCLMAIDSGFQACIMAPTEILAQQHYEGIGKMLGDIGVSIDLLVGSIKGKKLRRNIHEKLELGMTDILIGTHALIEDTVKFKNLGMVVIDEQHRFGVAQRARLWAKNVQPPHILVMTATPIPRTLAMTVYGDLEVSVIDELPPGRKAIKTFHFFDSKRLQLFQFMRDEIAKGRQVYIVYPLIGESETLDYKNLEDGYESISRAFPLPEYKVSIVHGQMHSSDKDFEMQRFKEGETQILVATTVIEVGVDVPNASVMVIESAERFGLAQLHQLRGRVGRGGEQSYCILMTGYKLSSEARTRMNTMVETTDGFKIAEVDMKLRGPGDLRGTQQSGILNMKLADITKDSKILYIARDAASEIVQEDPHLEKPENHSLKRYLKAMESDTRMEWGRIS